MKLKPVMLPPGRDRLSTNPKPTGSMTRAKTIGIERVSGFSSATTGRAVGEDHVGRERDQFLRVLANELWPAGGPAVFDTDVLAVVPAKIPQPLLERGDAPFAVRIVFGDDHQDAQLAHGLLRASRQRPRTPPCRRPG